MDRQISLDLSINMCRRRMRHGSTQPTRGALDLHCVGNFDREGQEVDGYAGDLMIYASSLRPVDAHLKMSRKEACMTTPKHTVSEIHLDDILNPDRGDARQSLSHEACFESEPQERKAQATRQVHDTSSIKRSKSDPVELVKATSKLSSSQPHDHTVQARSGRRSEAHTKRSRSVNNAGDIPVNLMAKTLLPSPTCIFDLKSYKACAAVVPKCLPGNHLAAVTADTNHTNPPKVFKVHAGKGTPSHKHASYDAYESYESEGQALEILFGLIFSLVLFVGVIVIVWGPGFVTSCNT
jgi:hypothetical protein